METRIRTYFTTLHEEHYLSIMEAQIRTAGKILENYPKSEHDLAFAYLFKIVKQAEDQQHINHSHLAMKGYL